MMRSGPVILLVDDEELLLRVYTSLLAPHVREVLTCASAREARHLISDKCREIDVVVADLDMPGCDGLVLLDEIERVRPEIKRILHTSSARPDACKHHHYVHKSGDIRDLIDGINEVLDAGRHPAR